MRIAAEHGGDVQMTSKTAKGNGNRSVPPTHPNPPPFARHSPNCCENEWYSKPRLHHQLQNRRASSDFNTRRTGHGYRGFRVVALEHHPRHAPDFRPFLAPFLSLLSADALTGKASHFSKGAELESRDSISSSLYSLAHRILPKAASWIVFSKALLGVQRPPRARKRLAASMTGIGESVSTRNPFRTAAAQAN